MYWSSADFSGWFRLKRKSRKTFDFIISEKSVFFNFGFGGFGVLQGCSPPLSAALVCVAHVLGTNSLKDTQSVFRRRYRKDPPQNKWIYMWCRQFGKKVTSARGTVMISHASLWMAPFYLRDRVNSHNRRVWEFQNPHQVFEHRDSTKWMSLKNYYPLFFAEKVNWNI
jgi:hypothetical protein